MQPIFTEEEKSGELSNFLRDLRHIHYYIVTYLKENRIKVVPTWFNEGLAEYISIMMKSGGSIYLSNEPTIFLYLETKSNGEDIVRKIIDDSRALKFEASFFQNTNIEISDLHEYMN